MLLNKDLPAEIKPLLDNEAVGGTKLITFGQDRRMLEIVASMSGFTVNAIVEMGTPDLNAQGQSQNGWLMGSQS